MSTLPGITLLVLLVTAVLIAIFKGSRSPQPMPSNPTPDKRAMFAALIPVVCAAISYATFKGLDLYLSYYPPYEGQPPFATAMRIAFLIGSIAPWFVGVYFAYSAARAANRLLRTIGALEVIVCFLNGSFMLFAATVGLG